MLVIKEYAIICIGLFSMFVNSINLDVPLIYQYPDFPTGCESVATVEMLQYFGYDITPDEFIDNYLDTISYNDSRIGSFKNIFDAYFVGNPRSTGGWMCNPSVEIRAVEKYFSEINEVNRSPVDLSGTDFNFLFDELIQGRPVVIWMTIGYVEPSEGDFWGSQYFTPSHTVVLTGFDKETNKVYICDSIKGYVELDYSLAKHLYDTVGRKCFTIK